VLVLIGILDAVKRTQEEVKMLTENIEQRKALCKQRRAEQEGNVHRKE
jgi:hypothetical protein